MKSVLLIDSVESIDAHDEFPRLSKFMTDFVSKVRLLLLDSWEEFFITILHKDTSESSAMVIWIKHASSLSVKSYLCLDYMKII